MKDFLGKEIIVGVKAITINNRYNEFMDGTIEKITPKMVMFKTNKGRRSGCPAETFKRHPDQIIILD